MASLRDPTRAVIECNLGWPTSRHPGDAVPCTRPEELLNHPQPHRHFGGSQSANPKNCNRREALQAKLLGRPKSGWRRNLASQRTPSAKKNAVVPPIINRSIAAFIIVTL